MKKINILIISYDFRLEAGGIQNTSYLLAEELAKYANVYTFCPSDGGTPQIPSVISFKSNSKNWTPEYFEESIREVKYIHKKYNIDYALVMHYLYAEPAYYLKVEYGVKFGILTHGDDVMSYPLGMVIRHPRSRIRPIIKRAKLLNKADNIFSNTYYTKRLVKRACLNRNISVIHPPICLRSVVPPTIVSKTLIILSVGRLDERKGFQNVIKALPVVISSIPAIKYIIAGEGEYEGNLRELVDTLHLNNHVEFKGRVTEEQKSILLSECGLFIMPSFEIKKKMTVEGFGLSMLEANLYGKFVISSYSGGIPEAVLENKTGFLVRENDIEGISKAILHFYNSDFSYNPQHCIDWAKSHHISKIAKKYFDIISQSITNCN